MTTFVLQASPHQTLPLSPALVILLIMPQLTSHHAVRHTPAFLTLALLSPLHILHQALFPLPSLLIHLLHLQLLAFQLNLIPLVWGLRVLLLHYT